MGKEKLKEFDDGNIYMWIEQDSSIMLKASDKIHNDPVELSSTQAREIAEYLIYLAGELEKE